MHNISFSVVIPLYNKVHFIEKTIMSVLKQTYKNYEIIVVDDGSTDGSDAIVMNMTKLNSQIHMLHQSNHGVSAARNKGMEIARNAYIAFLDADDLWDNDVLESYLLMIERYPGNSAFAVALKENPENAAFPKNKTMVVEDHVRFNSLFQTSCLCFKSGIIKKTGGFEEGVQLGEDRDYWLRVACNYQFVFYNKEAVLHPDKTENNLISLMFKKINSDKIFPYWNWYDYKSKFNLNIVRYASFMILCHSFYFYRNGQYEEARYFLDRIKGYDYFLKRIYLRLKLKYKSIKL